MEHSQQLVTNSSSCSMTISASNNIINNNPFNNNNSNSSTINANHFNSNSSTINNSSINSSSNNSSNNCNQNARLKELSPLKLILVPKHPFVKIMELCSSSLTSALISFLSTEENQSITLYEKTYSLPASFVSRLSETEEDLRTGFLRYQIFYEQK